MVYLEKLELGDLPEIIEWNADTDPEFLMQWAGRNFDYPITVGQLLGYCLSKRVNSASTDTFLFKAIEKETRKMIGVFEIGKIDRYALTARIGKVLVSPDYRGKGYGTCMMKEAARYAFEVVKLRKISLGVFDFNKAAIRCYLKAGFKIDGILRESVRFGKEYWNRIEMSMLYKDWRILDRVESENLPVLSVTPGKKYRHFKGNEYLVLSIARNSETLEEMVVYQALYGEYGVWVRPKAMFSEYVEHEGRIVPRFSEINETGEVGTANESTGSKSDNELPGNEFEERMHGQSAEEPENDAGSP